MCKIYSYIYIYMYVYYHGIFTNMPKYWKNTNICQKKLCASALIVTVKHIRFWNQVVTESYKRLQFKQLMDEKLPG